MDIVQDEHNLLLKENSEQAVTIKKLRFRDPRRKYDKYLKPKLRRQKFQRKHINLQQKRQNKHKSDK